MAQVINTNSLSLITQNNINKNQSALSTSIERLSSGLRISSAKDDAAGQAIANRFTSNIKGLTQAARNANDGISAAQTSEGALSEINNNLQRILELTVEAQNSTNSDSDKSSIQDEIKSRLDEIDRVSGTTQFNGVNVLAKDGSMKIQVSANDGETISIDLKKIDSSTLGLNTFNVTGPVSKTGTMSGLSAANLKSYYGDTTKITTTLVTEAATGDDLATRLGVAAGSVSIDSTAVADDNGNLFSKVTITPGSASEVNSLKANGFESEYDSGTSTGVAKAYYIALDPKDADTTTTPTTAAFNLDTSKLNLSNMVSGSTIDPLAKLDDAIASGFRTVWIQR